MLVHIQRRCDRLLILRCGAAGLSKSRKRSQLAEVQQTLVMNDLRSRIVVECDGQLKTGRDVAVACLLGAEEFGFATAPLVASGCIMMRACHLNTCPVGIATQNPELRKKFKGKPEHVVNFMYFVAQELREIMAKLGFRTVDEMVGKVEKLDRNNAIQHFKSRGIDLTPILHKVEVSDDVPLLNTSTQDHQLEKALDFEIINMAHPALFRKEPTVLDLKINKQIIIRTIPKIKFEARIDYITKGRLVKKINKNEKLLLDGCHSEVSAKNLANYLKTLKIPIFGIWSMTKNKDPDKFIKQFKGIFKKIITIPIENESAALSNKLLFQIAKNNNYSSETSKSFDEALKKISSKEKKIICVFGSLYLCGNILNKN